MTDSRLRVRELCLDQAQAFIDASRHLASDKSWAHIVYHLSLLALEEVGKASMLGALVITASRRDGEWIKQSLTDHRRKLLWAVWSPMTRIDPADFAAARKFAERAHAIRLESLYVNPDSSETDVPARDRVSHADADRTLRFAEARLSYERDNIDLKLDGVGEWFLDAMADENLAALLLSAPFTKRYEEMGGDARAWVAWAQDEIARMDEENRKLLAAEIQKGAAAKGLEKPKWRANTVVYTPSHSLRPKTLAYWNNRLERVQLLWSGKKDQFTLQITLDDNEPLASVPGRLTSLSKLVVACLSIGSIGYFWFERPGFERQIFKDVVDLEHDRPMNIGSRESFWGDGRAVALTEELIDHAMHCISAFAPLPDEEAEPIFGPYLHGLALLAKSDLFYSFDELARGSFVSSLAAGLRRYGGWNGKAEDFESALHNAFIPFMPETAHRDQLFRSLKREGDPNATALEKLRTAKHLADLYFIHVGRRTWLEWLEKQKQRQGPEASPANGQA